MSTLHFGGGLTTLKDLFARQEVEKKEEKIKYGTITLKAANWTQTETSATTFQQQVTIPNITTVSKIDIQPGPDVLAQMLEDGTTSLCVGNNLGVAYAFATENAPTADITLQYTRTELSYNS